MQSAHNLTAERKAGVARRTPLKCRKILQKIIRHGPRLRGRDHLKTPSVTERSGRRAYRLWSSAFSESYFEGHIPSDTSAYDSDRRGTRTPPGSNPFGSSACRSSSPLFAQCLATSPRVGLCCFEGTCLKATTISGSRTVISHVCLHCNDKDPRSQTSALAPLRARRDTAHNERKNG